MNYKLLMEICKWKVHFNSDSRWEEFNLEDAIVNGISETLQLTNKSAVLKSDCNSNKDTIKKERSKEKLRMTIDNAALHSDNNGRLSILQPATSQKNWKLPKTVLNELIRDRSTFPILNETISSINSWP